MKTKTNHQIVHNSEVYSTKEYNVFKLDLLNRPIDEKKVQDFIKRFNTGQFFLKDIPALIDDNFIIIDGQHRFEACKRTNLPFYYRISQDVTIKDVTIINNNAGWSPHDYIHSFVKQGLQNYIDLARFIKRYAFAPSVSVMLLRGGKDDATFQRTGFYTGQFKVIDEQRAHKKAKMIMDLEEAGITFARSAPFIRALLKVTDLPQYDHKHFMEKVELYGSKLKRQTSSEEYVRNLEEVYNFKCNEKNRVRFF